jgi:hypothetical protein
LFNRSCDRGIQPDGSGIVAAKSGNRASRSGSPCGVTLRFSHEVRGEEEYFSGIPEMKLPAEMVKLAQHIIETKSADFDPAMLEDHYRNALVRILRKKQTTKMPAPVAPSREKRPIQQQHSVVVAFGTRCARKEAPPRGSFTAPLAGAAGEGGVAGLHARRRCGLRRFALAALDAAAGFLGGGTAAMLRLNASIRLMTKKFP